jgi:glycine/D-amino acid oxidase-like deaminating enzyme
MLEAVDEVLAILQENGIDAQAKRSGNVVVARNQAAMARLMARRRTDLDWGYREDEAFVLDADEVASRINVQGAVGGLYYPTVARLNPGLLVLGLASLVESRGVQIYEHVPALGIEPGKVRTPYGDVRAAAVLRCTEAYSVGVSPDPRRIIPINSSILITEPLSDSAWQEIGWQQYECFSDAAHVFSYSQRTDDGRILIGGRGNPYRFGSATGGAGEVDMATVRSLTERLHRFFPVTRDAAIEHAWSGVIGVTRDWCASINFDAATGLGYAQGYAGHGVTSAYLAARSLADVVSSKVTSDSCLPWVGRQARNWEPEPIRWLGVHGMYRMFDFADRIEERSNAGKTSILARVGSRLAGLHD